MTPPTPFPRIRHGQSDLHVTPICLGTMTFGEQVDEPTAHAILHRSLERGIDFIDTAEMYAVPARAETFGATETIIGRWFEKNPGVRDKIVLATKVAGPSRGMPWVREGGGMTAADIVASCEGSLRRLKTDVIDLYQIHWPERHVPAFGNIYYDPIRETSRTSIREQLEALGGLVKAGKVRAIGLSNETPYGVHEFVRLAEQHGLPRVATVQNVYNLLSRALENGLDESMHRLGVSLLAYSPLAFGLLTGKYDESGITGPHAPKGARISRYESVRKQRWGRPESFEAARRYNALARGIGMTPTQFALAFCYSKWQVASTIIGVTSLAQLEEDLDSWDQRLPPDVLAEVDKLRWEMRDPAI
jgi:aryl-alcohol dehydrogenase-like predicted oxidoreductase